MARGSSTVHTLEFRVFQTGIDQVRNSLNTLNTTTQQATTQQGALSTATRNQAPAMQAAATGATQYSGALGNVNNGIKPVQGGLSQTNVLAGQNAVAYQTASGKAGEYAGSTNKVTSSVLPLVGRVTGLSFAFTGLFTSMGEAQGMQELLALSQAKVNELQALQTELVANGQQETALYTRVTNQLERAQGALVRQQTITNLSMQDSFFFIASITGQLMPLMIKGIVELRAKAIELGGGFTGLATVVSGKLQSGFVKFSEKIGLLPPMFTSAGKSANTFGGALRALALNPFTIAITAITAVLGIFITNTFGARDAINSFGVWLGNTFPPLKGLLGLLGQAGDALVTAFGGSINQVAQDIQTVIPEVDLLQEALIRIFDVSKSESLDVLIDDIDALRNIFNEAHIATTVSNGGLQKFEEIVAKIQNPSKETTALIDQMRAKLEEAAEAGSGDIEVKNELLALLEKYNAQLKKDVDAQKQAVIAQREAEAAATGYSQSVLVVQSAIEATSSAQAELIKGLSDTEKIMFELGDQTGLTGEELQQYLANLEKGIGVIGLYGKQTVIAKDGNVDLIATLKQNSATIQQVEKDTDALIASYVEMATQGIITWEEAGDAIEVLGDKSDLTGERVSKFLNLTIKESEITADKLSDMIDVIALGGEVIIETEDKTTEAMDKSIEKIDEKIDQYNLETQAANLNAKEKEALIQIHEAEVKANDKVNQKLRELAISRGADAETVAGSNQVLRTYIENNNLTAVTLEDVADATTILTAERENDTRETEIQEGAYQKLLETMGSQIDTTNLSVSTMQSLVKTYDDITNANQIAVGEVAKWNLELERSEAIERETILALEDLAERYEITIPESIRNGGVPAIKEFIEQILGVGKAAQEMAAEIQKTMDSMRSNAAKALEGIISDKLGEDGDEIKKAVKGLDKVGKGMDSLAAKETVISIFLDDTDFTNDVLGLSEIMELEFGDVVEVSKQGGIDAGDAFVEHVRDEVGKKGKPLADDVDLIWETVKSSSAPDESGREIVARFERAVRSNPGAVADAIRTGANDPLLAELGLLPPKAGATGQEVTNEVADGINSGKGSIEQAATISIVDPTTGKISEIPVLAQGELGPLEGIFSTEFIKASTVATGEINLILSSITVSMGHMKTNVSEALTEILGYWNDHATELAVALENIGVHVLTLQQTYSNLSTNIATYTESMTANLDNWMVNTSKTMDAYQKVVIELWDTFSNFSSSIATYSQSMTENLETFAEDTTENFDQLESDTRSGIWKALSDFSTSVSTYSKSMTQSIEDFVDDSIDNLENLMDTLDDAIDKIEDFIDAIEDIPSVKEVEIRQKFTSTGTKYFAKGGAFIVTAPTHIGDKIVGEAGPEIVTVTPLTGPNAKSSTVNLDLSRQVGPKGSSSVSASEMIGKGGAGGGAGSTGGGTGAPIIVRVTGNLNATLKTQSGRVMSQEVLPFLMEGTNSIT